VHQLVVKKFSRNMSVNLQIGFNNNFITNSFYTKFLGVDNE